MIFFSGFCLSGEIALFRNFIKYSEFTIAGFSKGAIDAIHLVLNTASRVDTLQLLSPAYFNNKSSEFKHKECELFKRKPFIYKRKFIKNAIYPFSMQEGMRKVSKYIESSQSIELENILYFRWHRETLEKILNKNINIEVFLGAEDKIIDSHDAMNFFQKYSTVYFIKSANHFLM